MSVSKITNNSFDNQENAGYALTKQYKMPRITKK